MIFCVIKKLLLIPDWDCNEYVLFQCTEKTFEENYDGVWVHYFTVGIANFLIFPSFLLLKTSKTNNPSKNYLISGYS